MASRSTVNADTARYVLSVYRGLFVLIALGVVPILVALPFRVLWFPDSNPNSWPLLLILGPATEESEKLSLLLVLSVFANLARIRLSSREPNLGRFLSPAFLFLVLPVASGLFNGLWEHYGSYATEPSDRLLLRLVAHTGYACAAFVTCLFVWRNGHRPAAGLWIGTLAGMVPHALFNFGRVAVLEWSVNTTFPYQPAVAFLSLAVAIALLGREVRKEPASTCAHLLVAKLTENKKGSVSSGSA